jgi:hypothetical protein
VYLQLRSAYPQSELFHLFHARLIRCRRPTDNGEAP